MEEGVELKSCELFSISDKPEKISSFTTILYNKGISVESEEADDAPSKIKSTRVCFNCGNEDHSLRDCPKPFNHIRIARNRMKFPSRGSKILEFTRYHKEIDDRFADFRPGKLSGRLKEALGLEKDKLPRYIYNMRRLGYPPGWLDEAKISHSGINMLDSNGERVPDPDEEEGEICSVRVRYDADKIIDYPGFNIWPDPGTINETDKYGSLPMCYDQSKKVFIDRLNDSSFNFESSVELRETSDMPCGSGDEMDVEEIEDAIRFDDDKNAKFGFVPPLPQENIPTPPPPPPEDLPPPPPGEDEDHSDNDDKSIIISDGEITSEEEEGELPSKSSSKLHRNKATSVRATSDSEQPPTVSANKKLKTNDKSIEDLSCSSPEVQPISITISNSTSFEKTSCSPFELNTTADYKEQSIYVNETDFIEPSTPETSKLAQDTFGRVKSVELGTPVLNHSPYTALPSPEKFRKDISDVIYFENLPNSTGTYERLKGVLKGVRSKLTLLKGDVKK